MKKINTLLQDIKAKAEELQLLINEQQSKQPQFPQCNIPQELTYVNLSDGSIEEKLKRIIEQVREHKINIIPTPKDSQIARCAIVKELGDEGMNFWLQIRVLKEDYDEITQMARYLYLSKNREKININLGALINLYKTAIDNYNNLIHKH